MIALGVNDFLNRFHDQWVKQLSNNSYLSSKGLVKWVQKALEAITHEVAENQELRIKHLCKENQLWVFCIDYEEQNDWLFAVISICKKNEMISEFQILKHINSPFKAIIPVFDIDTEEAWNSNSVNSVINNLLETDERINQSSISEYCEEFVFLFPVTSNDIQGYNWFWTTTEQWSCRKMTDSSVTEVAKRVSEEHGMLGVPSPEIVEIKLLSMQLHEECICFHGQLEMKVKDIIYNINKFYSSKNNYIELESITFSLEKD